MIARDRKLSTSKRASSALMPRTSTSLSAERMLSSLRGASRRGCGLGLGAFFFSSTRRSSFSLTVIFIGPACTCTPPSLSAGASTVAITPPTLSRRTRSPFCTERTSSASTTRFWMPRRCSFSVWVMTPRSAALAAARFWSAFFFCAFFLSVSSSSNTVSAVMRAFLRMLSACPRALSIILSTRSSAASRSARILSRSDCAAERMRCASSFICSTRRRSRSSSARTSSKRASSVETCSFARSMMVGCRPRRAAIANAFDLPGMPVSRR